MNSENHNPLFEKYFGDLYGERWPAIREALAKSEKQVLRKNLFLNDSSVVNDFQKCDFLENCFWRPAEFKLHKNDNGYFDYYLMDPASVIVAKALEAQNGDSVLDMCAAPGGKTLILAETMGGGELVPNEYSDGRRERLMHVLRDYVPIEQRMFIQVKGLDGNQYGLRYAGSFDRVLADVPCSGERHLLENPKEFKLWTERRTKNLAVRQYSLLSSAWLSLKVEGRLVYSTCSISKLENDDVVAKLVKKRGPQVLRLDWLDKIDFIEKTEFGYQILPDRCGFGPMYFSVMKKN